MGRPGHEPNVGVTAAFYDYPEPGDDVPGEAGVNPNENR
jgi:hypothetical protein